MPITFTPCYLTILTQLSISVSTQRSNIAREAAPCEGYLQISWRILALIRSPFFRNKTDMAKCPEYDHLHAQVENVLGNLAQASTLLLDLFRSNDLSAVHRLDQELELTLGEKERCIGALRQHVKEHNCVDGTL
jgi:hypothetical protein